MSMMGEHRMAEHPGSFSGPNRDLRGRIEAYLGEVASTDDPFNPGGGIAVIRVPRPRQLLRHLRREGFEHQVAMVRGSCAEAVEEGVSRYLGWTSTGDPRKALPEDGSGPALGLPEERRTLR